MPTLVLNNWQGMLGNSIIQVYNSILIGLDKKYNILLPDPNNKHKFSKFSKFYKKRKIVLHEDSDDAPITNRYNFYYQMWMPEYKDSFEMNHEEALEILKGVLTLCDKELEPISKNTLVLHMRSGDIFSNCPHPKYIPPPLSFYKNILKEHSYDKVLITTENTRNPCLKLLENMPNVKWTGGNLERDIETIMSATHLVFGIGSFVPSLLMLSNNIEKIYVPSNYGVPRILEGEKCLFGKKIELIEYNIDEYIKRIGNNGVRSRMARDVMIHYPDEVKIPESVKQNPKNNIETIMTHDEMNKEELSILKLKKVVIKAGELLDRVVFNFDKNKNRYYGKNGGKVVKEIVLNNEVITGVQQIYKDSYLGHGIIITTTNNKYVVSGKGRYKDDCLQEEYKAKASKEIIGLVFDKNKIVGIETRDIIG